MKLWTVLDLQYDRPPDDVADEVENELIEREATGDCEYIVFQWTKAGVELGQPHMPHTYAYLLENDVPENARVLLHGGW